MTIVEYTYSGDGDLVRRTAGGETVDYTLDPVGLIDILEARSGGDVTTYLYGLGAIGEEAPGGQQYFYGRDALGSVRFVMDNDAELVGRYEYGPFGDPYGHVGVGTGFQFAGELWDDDSQLYYLRARHYSPALGRFMSRDPFPGLMQVPQTLNPYVYVGNNPVNLTDPSGELAPLLIPMIVGGVTGGAFAYWAYLQEHPCADFFHDRAFQQAVGAGMLAGVAGGAAGYLAGYVLVALVPETGLVTAIVVGMAGGSAEGGATQVATNALTSRSLTDGLTTALLVGGLSGGVGGAAGHSATRLMTAARRSARSATRLLKSPRIRGKATGPTIDRRTGWEVGRFIADEHGNAMIQPVGRSTTGGGFVQTRYPNGSYYQRLELPHRHWPRRHAHGHLEGLGWDPEDAGFSVDVPTIKNAGLVFTACDEVTICPQGVSLDGLILDWSAMPIEHETPIRSGKHRFDFLIAGRPTAVRLRIVADDFCIAGGDDDPRDTPSESPE